MPYSRFIIGLLLGICLVHFFPFLATWWIFVGMLLVFVANEVIGQWGFGSHWPEYRLSSYLLYTGVFVCIGVGIFLGSGDVGRLLITVGKWIS